MSHYRGASPAFLLLGLLVGAPLVGGHTLQGFAPSSRLAPQSTTAATPPFSVADRVGRVRAALLSGSANPADVIDEIKAILAIDPSVAEAHLLLGLAYRGQGSYPMLVEAIAEFRQALALDPSLLAVRFYLATAYLDLDRPGRAREELQLALEKLPGQTQFQTQLAEAERRLGNPTRALQLLEEAVAAMPGGAGAQEHYFMGLALRDLDRRAEAIAQFEAVVRIGTKGPEAYLELSKAYLDDGRLEDATRMMVSAATLAPSRPDIRIALAHVYRLNGLVLDAERQLAQAFTSDAAVEASSFYETLRADLNLEVGLVRLAQQRLDEALTALSLAAELRPAHGPTELGLAELYAARKEYDNAAVHLARAESAGATVPDALRADIARGTSSIPTTPTKGPE